MRESFVLNVAEELLQALVERKTTISNLLDTLFMNSTEGASKLLTALIGYHWFEGGAPDYKNLQIIDCHLDIQTLNGFMQITYLLERTFGCADIQTKQTENQKWHFSIDKTATVIIFEGPNDPSRQDEI
ncbi:MAG TPA: hypothetical protein VN040_10525 [Pseudosphingobacterium sp.]|nr:hypothetical protein [Pseudosphingobacterium sp.]